MKKQGKPLQRKTPLKRSGASLKSSGFRSKSFWDVNENGERVYRSQGLSSGGSSKQRMSSDMYPSSGRFKRPVPSMTKEERETRKIVERRSGGVCEMCGRARATEKAHRVSRRVGPWSPQNILDGCHDCHAYNHAHPAEAYGKGQHLESWRNPDVEAVFFHHEGRLGWAVLKGDGTFIWV